VYILLQQSCDSLLDDSNISSTLPYYAHIERADGSPWPSGNTLASDANGPGSTPGGTLELDTGYHPFVVGVAISEQWVTAVEDCGCKCSRCGSALACGREVKLCDSIKHGPCSSALRLVV